MYLFDFRQFFGEPIQCDAGSASDGIDGGVLNSYCWMYSTWNIPQTYKGACSAGMEFGGITLKEWQEHSVTIVYNSYYQWVPLYLIILAFLFYLPRMCWLIMEGGLMEFFGKGTTTRFVEDQEEKKDILVDFFRKNVHNKYNSVLHQKINVLYPNHNQVQHLLLRICCNGDLQLVDSPHTVRADQRVPAPQDSPPSPGLVILTNKMTY